MSFKRLAIILGDQLFPDHHHLNIGSDDLIFMAEDKGLCTHYKFHKQKLIFTLAAMRSYADILNNNYSVHYSKLEEDQDLSYEEKLLKVLNLYSDITEVIAYEVEDQFMRARLIDFCKRQNLHFITIESPGFVTSHEKFKEYMDRQKNPFMHTFYQWQRKRLGILLDQEAKPLHGEWSFDKDNRKKLPKGIDIPPPLHYNKTQHVAEVTRVVEEFFPNHPGSSADFNWATTRKEALHTLDNFLEVKFNDFGPYEDAVHSDYSFNFHSTLSPYLNTGLITPDEVIDRAIEYGIKNNVHYPSLEGFVRQIIGWREFMRGMYNYYDLRGNFFECQGRLNDKWYEGSTGLTPIDDCIKKVVKHAYGHHIERLMFIGNTMLLCGIHPDEVYRWFMEMYIDSAEWVMVPNVYGMSQFADGGIFATKPYICGSNYIVKMSNYKKDSWSETMDSLFWSFIHKHQKFFTANPRMSMMVHNLKKRGNERVDQDQVRAERFIKSVTE